MLRPAGPVGETPHRCGPPDRLGYYFIQTKSPQTMSLMSLLVTLIVVGVLLWLVNTYIPMDGKIKQILNVVVVICVVIWLLSAFGVLGHAHDLRVPQLR